MTVNFPLNIDKKRVEKDCSCVVTMQRCVISSDSKGLMEIKLAKKLKYGCKSITLFGKPE